MAQMNPADQAKMQMMQDLEIEMMSDLYNRMTQACHKKCVPPRYSEPDLGKFDQREVTSSAGYLFFTIFSSYFLQERVNQFAWIVVWPNI